MKNALYGGVNAAVLTAMNLLNYVDRYVPSAVKDLVKLEASNISITPSGSGRSRPPSSTGEGEA